MSKGNPPANPFPKGQPRPKTGGRRKGTPNRATQDVRAAISMLAEETVGEVRSWLAEIEDPAKRFDLWLRMIEYHIPKLGRVEHTGEGGKEIVVQILDPTRADPAAK